MRNNLRAERIRLGLTAGQVASEIDVHPNTLLAWERGESQPLSSNLMKLSEYYDCSPDYLLGLQPGRMAGLVTA